MRRPMNYGLARNPTFNTYKSGDLQRTLTSTQQNKRTRNGVLMQSISKNTGLRPGRPVGQTHMTHRTLIANQDAPGAHLTLRTHQAHLEYSGRNQTQHLILRTQPDAVPTLPEITEISEGSPLYLFLTLVTQVTIYFISSKGIKFTTNSLLFF